MVKSISWSRTPLFWIVLTLISISGLFFSYHYFPKAFAILNITISMDRQQALAQAKTLATNYQWGPTDYQQVAVFETDDETKNFIELEGGGVSALNEIIQEKWYTPYFWKVRHFKELNAHETIINFTPAGIPYGFIEKFAQEEPGAALSTDQARALAERQILEQWHTNLTAYKLVESSQEIVSSGRVDHLFTYERSDRTIADAPFRLEIGVSGDHLSKLTHSIKVPEAFKRRYEHMRSANNTIAFGALFLIGILYLVIGCFAGLAFLLRRHALCWRPAFIVALIISLLQILNKFNQLPLEWIEYETALSKNSFYIHLLTSMISSLFLYTALFTLIFAVAEGLTRLAFGYHLQFWYLWNRKTSSSIQVIGRTIGGYLIIGFDLAFVTAMYAFASHYLGWWTPSETLFNPNILATHFPWFSSLAQSLQAGFMEECLFRALPLAGAALLARRFKHPFIIMSVAFIVQALIFGAAHANYPAQPAYARVIELIIPSFVFGGIYLFYGLLPAIISHTIFDVFWFALPLFISTAPGFLIDKALVIGLSLIPLWMVVRGLFLTGGITDAPKSAYNHAWQSTPHDHEHHEEETLTETRYDFKKRTLLLMAALGAAAFALWLALTPFKQNNLTLKVTRPAAVELFKQKLQNEGVQLPQPPWQPLSTIEATIDEHERFVWQKVGKGGYMQLLGTYITPAVWKIRFAQFEGDLVERAEEYGALVQTNGFISREVHQIPESRAGASLTEQEARTKSYAFIKALFNINPTTLNEISAINHKQPGRLDWQFTFKDTTVTLPEIEARISITLHGDQLGDYERFVFVPEEWQRADKQYQTVLTIFSMICRLVLLFFLVIFGFMLAKSWRRFKLPLKLFGIFCIILTSKAVVQAFNIWPMLVATFETSEPYEHQLFSLIGTLIFQILFQVIGLSAGAAVASGVRRTFDRPMSLRTSLLLAIPCGLIFAATRAIAQFIVPLPKPLFAEYTYAGAVFPTIGFALAIFTSYISATVIWLLISRVIDLFTHNWKSRKMMGCISLVTIIIAVAGMQIDSISSWLVSGTIASVTFTLLYYFIIRHQHALIPLFVATTTILFIIQQAIFNAYPGAIVGSLLSTILVGILAYWWYKKLE
ncbi:MAG: CAAX amino terminal protease self- immunity [Candidatus Dependentiae bacterium ADurb.Bin331]|nr:MAG: CAAX amino terminal protease self- immunity [Candidatus Dependentiae bacterium ADurb.Bin331]